MGMKSEKVVLSQEIFLVFCVELYTPRTEMVVQGEKCYGDRRCTVAADTRHLGPSHNAMQCF